MVAGVWAMAWALGMGGATSMAVGGPVAEGTAPAKATKKSEQVRGFCIQLSDAQGTAKYIAAIDELAEMGCSWINFAIAARQQDVKAESIHINWQNIPSRLNLEKILKHAKAKGIRTVLMPMVLLDTAGEKEWRGAIKPADWDNWFDSYRHILMGPMADLAQACDVDILCVGSELLTSETYLQQWTEVIKSVRARYKGKLTYSANWDHYEVPKFWDQLDYISMNCYHELADRPGATVAQLNASWANIKKALLKFVDEQKRPFFFTEVGWHNLENTVSQPWNYVAKGKIDSKEQLRAYESFVESWKDVPTEQFMGALFWEWKPDSKPTDHGTYSLQGQPALEVVKKWMAAK